jgi:hypothetical protein
MLDNNDDFSDDNTDELIRNAIGSNKETKSESIKLGVTPQQSKCTFTNTLTNTLPNPIIKNGYGKLGDLQSFREAQQKSIATQPNYNVPNPNQSQIATLTNPIIKNGYGKLGDLHSFREAQQKQAHQNSIAFNNPIIHSGFTIPANQQGFTGLKLGDIPRINTPQQMLGSQGIWNSNSKSRFGGKKYKRRTKRIQPKRIQTKRRQPKRRQTKINRKKRIHH